MSYLDEFKKIEYYKQRIVDRYLSQGQIVDKLRLQNYIDTIDTKLSLFRQAFIENWETLDLDKFNEQKSRKFFFFKKKDDDENLQYADLIKNIQKLYKELDKAKVYNKIYTDLDDSATIYDVFKFANSFKTYVRDISIIYIPTITPEEIDELIIDFDNFIKSTNIQIINNILIKEEKDISLIIKDRYSLLKFNITKDDVQEDNIDDLYQILSKLKLDINIEKANMNISQISEIMSLYETIK